MKANGKSTRYHERTKLEVPIEIVYNEDSETAWREDSVTEELTICGGGFTLSRPVEPKRLIRLRLPMPRNLRAFDFGKAQYDVWAVVRYVQMIESGAPGAIRLKVGAALVGDYPPSSFTSDPTTLYDLKPVLRTGGLWDLRELPRSKGRFMRSWDERRQVVSRVVLETVSERGQIIERVEAETQNVSEGGMAVISKPLNAHPSYVLVKTPDQSLTLLAKVRGVRVLHPNDTWQMHLEFISGKWLI